MNNNMTIREMMTAARVLKKQGERFTLLGVGPMSKTLLTAALSLAKERDFPLMLIASRSKRIVGTEYKHPIPLIILGAIVVGISLYSGIQAVPGILNLFG